MKHLENYIVITTNFNSDSNKYRMESTTTYKGAQDAAKKLLNSCETERVSVGIYSLEFIVRKEVQFDKVCTGQV